MTYHCGQFTDFPRNRTWMINTICLWLPGGLLGSPENSYCARRENEFGSWVGFLAEPLSGCMTLGKSLDVSEPQFSSLQDDLPCQADGGGPETTRRQAAVHVIGEGGSPGRSPRGCSTHQQAWGGSGGLGGGCSPMPEAAGAASLTCHRGSQVVVPDGVTCPPGSVPEPRSLSADPAEGLR